MVNGSKALRFLVASIFITLLSAFPSQTTDDGLASWDSGLPSRDLISSRTSHIKRDSEYLPWMDRRKRAEYSPWAGKRSIAGDIPKPKKFRPWTGKRSRG